MSERKPLLKWVSREREWDGVMQFDTEPRSKVTIVKSVGGDKKYHFYTIWLDVGDGFCERDFKSRNKQDLNEALLYAEKILAETDPEFYLKHAVLTDV